MFVEKDEWEWEIDISPRDKEEEEENDESARYFDVPLPYCPPNQWR